MLVEKRVVKKGDGWLRKVMGVLGMPGGGGGGGRGVYCRWLTL